MGGMGEGVVVVVITGEGRIGLKIREHQELVGIKMTMVGGMMYPALKGGGQYRSIILRNLADQSLGATRSQRNIMEIMIRARGENLEDGEASSQKMLPRSSSCCSQTR
jgi:hypothetical protein